MLPASRNALLASARARSARALLLVAIAVVSALATYVRLVSPLERSARVAPPLGAPSSPVCEPQPQGPHMTDDVAGLHLMPCARPAPPARADVGPPLREAPSCCDRSRAPVLASVGAGRARAAQSSAREMGAALSPGRARARLMVFLI